MKKNLLKYLLSLIFLIGIIRMEAAQVAIPDANFRTFHETTCPACMSGGMLDTECPGIINATSSNLNGKNIANLTGLEYFVGLTSLSCNNNQLTALPALPPNLLSLSCRTNDLTSLPALPSSLTFLDCPANDLVTLPVLPSGLETLIAFNNDLTSLPDLPAGLYNLNVGANDLTSLPVLPSLLGILSCNNNQLTVLPDLPSSLSELYCGSNQLTALPTLPSTLSVLECPVNLLTTLPALPDFLTSLSFGFNDVSVLPALPSTLSYVSCRDNALTALPALPASLNDLIVSNNQLTELPELPNSLFTLSIDGNTIECLPVLPNSLISLTADESIACLPNLPTEPSFTSNIGTTVCSQGNNPNGCILTAITKKHLNTELLKVYPNPSKGEVSILFDSGRNGTIKVVSVDGRTIFTKDQADFNKTITLDFSKEQKGIYVVQLLFENELITKKFILN